MVGLVVGLLVRHLEDADRLLDPYLAEPMIWHHEFGRMVHESSGLAASSEGIVQAERRKWSLREAAMLLVLHADETRADELRTIGQQLVATARRLVVEALGEDGDEAAVEKATGHGAAWASGLDRATYEAHEAEGGVYIQSGRPTTLSLGDAAQATKSCSAHRRQRASWSGTTYSPSKVPPRPLTRRRAHLRPSGSSGTSRESARAQPQRSVGRTSTAVAAAALEAHIVVRRRAARSRHCASPRKQCSASERAKPSPRQFEFEESYFEQGADRSAARVLPLLLLPNAAALRACMDAGGRVCRRTHVPPQRRATSPGL